MCTYRLDCPNTLCCIDGICTDTDKCRSNRNTVYVLVGLIGFGFLIVACLYMFYNISSIRRNVEQKKIKKREEDGLIKKILMGKEEK